VEITPSEFRFVIRDPGPGFHAAARIDAAGNATNLTEHGRGIRLIRSLMDDVTFAHNGSELHMTKLRTL
jgi:anti-sigma regulatory factor (Ser/Thr protein kinase)